MTKEDEYRKNAAQSVELAKRASSPVDKGHLLLLAEGWLDLADRVRRRIAKLRDHTLLGSRLESDRIDRTHDHRRQAMPVASRTTNELVLE